MLLGAAGFLVIAVLLYITYLICVVSKSSLHEKYDYKAAFEIKRLKIVFLFIALFSFFVINLYGKEYWEKVSVSLLVFGVRMFMALIAAASVYYIASLILDYYYPHRLSRSLKALRTRPRINPKTGNKMRLLREDEEDVHLNEGMQAEEDIFSVDYDVWIDEQSGDTTIEKYEGHKVALKCNSCGFVTMRVFKEEVLEKDDNDIPTQIVKHYQCSYCKNFRATAFNVSHKDINDLKNNIGLYKVGEDVQVSITSMDGGKEKYDFKSMKEAKKFLSDKSE